MSSHGRLFLLISTTLAFGACASSQTQSSAPTAASGYSGRGAWVASCSDDAAKLCPNTQGHRALRQCLMQNQGSLSQACQQALAAAPSGRGRWGASQ